MARRKTAAIKAEERRLQAQQEKNRLWVQNAVFHLLTLMLAWWVYFGLVKDRDLPPAFLVTWATLFIMRALITSLSQRFYHRQDARSTEAYTLVSTVRMVLSVLILGVVVFPVLFYSALPQLLSAFLLSVLKVTTEAATSVARALLVAASTISGYLGTIALGILANLIYDAAKHLLRKPESRGGQKQSPAPRQTTRRRR